MSGILFFLIPLLAGLAIIMSDVDNTLVKAIGYVLVAVFGLGLILMIL